MRGEVLLIAMLATTAARPQVAPSATGGPPSTQTQMTAPPPVSGAAYPTEVGDEVRTNYLRGGLTCTTAYVNNLYAGSVSASIAETTVSVLPTIAYDMTTDRRHIAVAYSPGFTFYQPSTALNEVDNTAMVNYDFQLTKHTAFSATDSFQDSSSPFNPGDAGAGGTVSGDAGILYAGGYSPLCKAADEFRQRRIHDPDGAKRHDRGLGLDDGTALSEPGPDTWPL